MFRDNVGGNLRRATVKEQFLIEYRAMVSTGPERAIQRAGDKLGHRHPRKRGPASSGVPPVSSLDDLVAIPSPRNPHVIWPETVEGSVDLYRGREVGLDPIAQSFAQPSRSVTRKPCSCLRARFAQRDGFGFARRAGQRR